MALRRPSTVLAVAAPPEQTLVAAAAQMLDNASVASLRINEERWAREAWRHFDICAELHYCATWVAKALSKVKLYIAERDENGDPGEEAKEANVRGLAAGLLGGFERRAENVRLLGTADFLVGECYIVAEGKTNNWYIISKAEIRKSIKGGGGFEVKRPEEFGGGWYQITKGADLLIRHWSPHPRLHNVADSPVRPALPILREIERLTMLVFSQIDSRLVMAGLLLLKKGFDFPHDPTKPGGVVGLLQKIMEAAEASLQGAGTAQGIVPILLEIEADNVAQAVSHVTFDAPVAAELKDKLDHAIRRLATGLDLPPEQLLGMGGANHWGAWQIEESTVKIHIDPIASRLCSTLTTGYLQAALKTINVDPNKYVVWYDASPLTVRPNRLADAIQLYDRGELSGKALIDAGAFDDNDIPDEKDRQRWLATKLIMSSPQLAGDPTLAKLAGLPVMSLPAGQAQPTNGAPTETNAIPAEPTSTTTPAQESSQYAALLPAAEQMVLRALEYAGGRLLAGHGRRSRRGEFADCPRHELHTRVKATDPAHARELLAGGFPHVDTFAHNHPHLAVNGLGGLLTGYCAELLIRGYPHDTVLLGEVLKRATARKALT